MAVNIGVSYFGAELSTGRFDKSIRTDKLKAIKTLYAKNPINWGWLVASIQASHSQLIGLFI
jgi:hypothetical protein